MKKRNVYLDHAATTPIDPAVLKAMQPFFSQHYGNPSALYKEGLIANGALNDARRSVAEILRTQPDCITFTSGGTESDNMAVLGIARAHAKHGKHIITTQIEHHAVLYPVEQLQKEGWEITILPVDRDGFVKAQDVIKAIRPDTTLISVMYANNEIGTIQPIAEIGRQLLRLRKEKGSMYPFFHTDAAQAAGCLELDAEKLHVDLMTINGGKIYGPKGTGLLYVRRGVTLQPIMFGGSQERNVRAGTENLPGIVGLAKALELSQKNKIKESKRERQLVESFWKQLQKKVKTVSLNGPAIGEGRLPNNLNVCFEGVDGEALVIYLDSLGIMAATGSACTAVSREPSHVLKAIGKSEAEILSSVRFTIGKTTTKQGLDSAFKALIEALKLIHLQ